MDRRAELTQIFDKIEPEQRLLVSRLLDEFVFLEEKMAELKKLPFIRQHPRDPSMQKTTPAAKQYKECSQSYMNAVRILSSVLKKTESSAEDDLMRLLELFE